MVCPPNPTEIIDLHNGSLAYLFFRRFHMTLALTQGHEANLQSNGVIPRLNGCSSGIKTH